MTRCAGVLTLVVSVMVGVAGCSGGEGDAARTAQTSAAASASIGETTMTVQKSTFAVSYRLSGLTIDSAAVGVDIPRGAHLTDAPRSGASTSLGDALGTLKPSDADASEPAGTVEASRRAMTSSRLRTLRSPASGRVHFTGRSAKVSTSGIDVAIPLKPLQELRYRGMEFTGSVTTETVLGQEEGTCQSVWIEDSPQPSTGDDGTGASATLHCRLPADFETAPGLPAVVTLTSERLDKVITIPVLYISLDKGGQNYVVQLRRGGRPTEQKITVGATDGVRRTVIEGLEPGDVIVLPEPS